MISWSFDHGKMMYSNVMGPITLKKKIQYMYTGREIPGSSFKMQVTTDSFTDALPGSVLRGKHICAGQSLVHAMYLRVK